MVQSSLFHPNHYFTKKFIEDCTASTSIHEFNFQPQTLRTLRMKKINQMQNRSAHSALKTEWLSLL